MKVASNILPIDLIADQNVFEIADLIENRKETQSNLQLEPINLIVDKQDKVDLDLDKQKEEPEPEYNLYDDRISEEDIVQDEPEYDESDPEYEAQVAENTSNFYDFLNDLEVTESVVERDDEDDLDKALLQTEYREEVIFKKKIYRWYRKLEGLMRLGWYVYWTLYKRNDQSI